ncbi:MAG: OmpA family protein [Bacteroidia bacterium]|nr:OmpA family protein [Bacteroidia bacterium]
MNLKRSAILLFLLFSVSVAFGQSKDYQKGEEAFEFQEFWTAIEHFKVAYSKYTDPVKKAELIFKIALSYRSLYESKEAELWFKKAIKVKYPDPLAVLYYADALKMNGAFEEAIVEYNNFGKLVPGDKRAEIGVKSCELASKWIEKPTRYAVENMAFFNSKDQDFSPVYAKKDYKILYFTSNRSGSAGDQIHAVTGAGFMDLWETALDRKGKWSEPKVAEGTTINTPDDEGASSLNLKGNTLYFTRCRVDKKLILGCKLYQSARKGTAWGESTEILINGAVDSTSIGHPSISDDEMTLYFAANLPGGYGARDIWMIKRDKKNGPWNGDAINAGPEINTPGNEVFPYIRNNGKLYFSSDYHIGMGGLDIFEANPDAKTSKYKISNLKSPINSNSDDFGIIYEGETERGFFSSSRKGGKGGNDIYQFYLPPLQFNISGLIKDCKTDELVIGAKVLLKGSDGTSVEMVSEADGSYKFKLNPNTDYQIFTSKEKFLSGNGGESTKGLEENKDFKLDICMDAIREPIVLQNIEYDLGKWDLRPESMVSLDELVKTLNNNANIVIELGSHTDFRSDDKYNLDLSQKRAQSVVNYLIEKGIESDRLVAKGYGETTPKKVDKKLAERYSGFLKADDILTEPFIKKLSTVEEQEVCHQANRRTEFRVLREDYVSKKQNVIAPTNLPNETPENNTTPENTPENNNQ